MSEILDDIEQLNDKEKKTLNEFMQLFDRATRNSTGMSKVSGGYSSTSFDRVEAGLVYMQVLWGINGVHSNREVWSFPRRRLNQNAKELFQFLMLEN